METFLSRYRNLSVLLLLLIGQLLLLAYQVKTQQDVRLIRIWAVTAVTPLARTIEGGRSWASNLYANLFLLGDVRANNAALLRENGNLKLRNQFLEAELEHADRSKTLAEYRTKIPSKLLPARVIGTGTGANSRVVYIDRGTVDGVRKGMAAIVPEGIVGKVLAAYPMAALVQLITEQNAVAGVISQKNKVRGTLKGQGSNTLMVDYVQNEEKLEPGEWFYTSGADRVFPRGLPVGQIKMVREGRGGKEVTVAPSGLAGGLDELLVVIDGVHGTIPDVPSASQEVQILPPPPAAAGQPASGSGLASPGKEGGQPGETMTEADRLKEKYRRIGESQGLVIGTTPGRAPDFNRPATAAPKAPATGQEPAKAPEKQQ
jgi:rod shape-determining protein MreC